MTVNYPAVYNSGTNAWTSLGKVPFSSTEPQNPSVGDIWIDSSLTPPSLKVYDGTSWLPTGSDDGEAFTIMLMGV